MMTFDGWDARYCGDAMALPGDDLAHWRTRGSKNGVRRYQDASGRWTPLGLRMRKQREGWGDGEGESKAERKAAKNVAKAEKKAARAEKKVAKAAEAKEHAIRSTQKKNGLDNLTDAELRRKIERAKMETEYRELTKSPALKTAENVAKGLWDYMGKRADRKWEREKMGLERAKIDADRKRIEADVVRSKEQTKTAKENAKQAAKKAKEKKYDVKGGLALQRKAELKRAKKDLKESTFIGSFIKTHKEAKLGRIENRKAIRRGTAFVKSLIKSQKKIDNWNWANDHTKLKFDAERYEGQHKAENAQKLGSIVAKQREAEAKKANGEKWKSYWDYRTKHG